MGTPTIVRVWESELAVYRKIWHSHVLLAFVQPLLYLIGMGLGVGALIDVNSGLVVLARRPHLLRVPRAGVARHDRDDQRRPGVALAGARRILLGQSVSGDGGDAAHTERRRVRSDPVACNSDVDRRGRGRRRARAVRRDPVVGAAGGGPGGGADRTCVRTADHRVVVDPVRRRIVPDDHPVRSAPDVPVRRSLLPDRGAARLAAARSRTSRRCGTASSCAVAP